MLNSFIRYLGILAFASCGNDPSAGACSINRGANCSRQPRPCCKAGGDAAAEPGQQSRTRGFALQHAQPRSPIPT